MLTTFISLRIAREMMACGAFRNFARRTLFGSRMPSHLLQRQANKANPWMATFLRGPCSSIKRNVTFRCGAFVLISRGGGYEELTTTTTSVWRKKCAAQSTGDHFKHEHTDPESRKPFSQRATEWRGTSKPFLQEIKEENN